MNGRRRNDVVDAIAGPAFAGVLVKVSYTHYGRYLRPHQRFWARLLRELHTLVASSTPPTRRC